MTRIISNFVVALVLANSAASLRAQEVVIPDPALAAAIREALIKPTGPLTIPDMLGLTSLSAGGQNISNVEGLETARNLRVLDLDNNSVTNFPIAGELTNLTILDLFGNHLSDFVLSNNAPNLTILDIAFNSLASCSLPAGMTNLTALFLENNALTNFSVPAGLTHLVQLDLSGNQLASFSLPGDETNLNVLFLQGNQLTNVTLPPGLIHLAQMDLRTNNLTSLTLPPDMTNLVALDLDGNPLATLVLSEPAAERLASTITTLRNQGVNVLTYPLAPQLVRVLPLAGAFKFGITGPPGVYSVFHSTNLTTWNVLNFVANPLGGINFVDITAQSSPVKFYRVLLQVPPTNMVFIPPNTFTMGSATNDFDRSIFEGPQATVTLTRGFWIGKYEVTQGEYLDLTGENPSDFPGDLSRPISSVTWSDATNYCAKLTQRERAAGRIPPGSAFRLPTEAEWECAARAGTTTRFSYGDDPFYLSTTNYAWFLDLGHPDLIVHPVGEKIPNGWGLYDTAGNVWEWCQDWYGDQVGGVQTDPTGPASNSQGLKVMRGGAYDYPNSSCRSASRLFRFFNMPDSDLGFRVVLAAEP
jgi:formylglycine-generating enzyme required for sulfatase activity